MTAFRDCGREKHGYFGADMQHHSPAAEACPNAVILRFIGLSASVEFMRATEFEFRYRFWFIILLFVLAFACYYFDPVNAAWGVAQALHQFASLPEAREKLAVRVLLTLACVLMFLAALIRTWGTAYLRTEVVQDSSLHAERLVADGPYRRTRNPLYLGNLFLAAGTGLMASRLGWLVLFSGMALFTYRLILREEAELAGRQRESYRAYLAAVPRLLPLWRPLVPTGGVKPRWFQAVIGESLMWALTAATVIFLTTSNRLVARYIYPITVCVCLLFRALFRKRPAASDQR